MRRKKVLFVTGTRADFGKLKPLIIKLENDPEFEVHIFVTGMHMLSKFGYTVDEIKKCGFRNIFTFISYTGTAPMDIILSNTIFGISNYVREFMIDMIIVHGDRVEALAGAIVGALNNVIVSHIEGGELSGTVDELLRHSISKLSHLHFVSNNNAKQRLIQMGEKPESIFYIGSPDIDIMLSNELPDIDFVKQHYNIDFKNYSIFIYHPVTTELQNLRKNIREVISALIESGRKYIGVYPNNDMGNEILMEEMGVLMNHNNFRIFPSIRFEYFLVFLKNCDFIIGNSSAGVREAEVYGKTAINIGTRQQNRHHSPNIINVREDKNEILDAIRRADTMVNKNGYTFGDGRSSERFYKIIKNNKAWEVPRQKYFVDIDF